MDDICTAVGRQVIELLVQREQLIAQVKQLQQEVTTLRAPTIPPPAEG